MLNLRNKILYKNLLSVSAITFESAKNCKFWRERKTGKHFKNPFSYWKHRHVAFLLQRHMQIRRKICWDQEMVFVRRQQTAKNIPRILFSATTPKLFQGEELDGFDGEAKKNFFCIAFVFIASIHHALIWTNEGELLIMRCTAEKPRTSLYRLSQLTWIENHGEIQNLFCSLLGDVWKSFFP